MTDELDIGICALVANAIAGAARRRPPRRARRPRCNPLPARLPAAPDGRGPAPPWLLPRRRGPAWSCSVATTAPAAWCPPPASPEPTLIRTTDRPPWSAGGRTSSCSSPPTV